MIVYPDGTKPLAGDKVTLAHGAHTGIVQNIINSKSELDQWGLDKPGLMIDTSFGGLVFYPADSLTEDEIEFSSRQVA